MNAEGADEAESSTGEGEGGVDLCGGAHGGEPGLADEFPCVR